MASILKRPESPFYFCCFTAPDGRQLKKTTKQRNRTKALRICLEWQAIADEARAGTLTEVQTRKVMGELLEKGTGEKLKIATARDYLLGWVQSKEKTRAEGTAKRYRHTIESFLDHLGVRADTQLGSLRPADFESFRDLQVDQGKSAVTANMVLKTLRVPLNLARRQGLILSNPAEAVDTLPADGETRDAFTSEQISRILAASTGDWLGLLLVGRYCGLRLGDAAALKKTDLVRQDGILIIRVFPQKQKRAGQKQLHVVPVHPVVEKWIADNRGRTRSATTLFPSLAEVRLSGCNGLSAQFLKIMRRAEVSPLPVRRGKGRTFHKLSFHSLRHTFVSRLANAGIAPEVRMKLSGHTSEVHRTYTHHEMANLHSAVINAGIDADTYT